MSNKDFEEFVRVSFGKLDDNIRSLRSEQKEFQKDLTGQMKDIKKKVDSHDDAFVNVGQQIHRLEALNKTTTKTLEDEKKNNKTLAYELDKANRNIKQLEDLCLTLQKEVRESVTGGQLKSEPLDDTERCIIVANLNFDKDEDLDVKCEHLIMALNVVPKPKIVDKVRMKPRKANGVGVVKIAFETKDQKIAVLTAKKCLGDNEIYKTTWIHSSKTFLERKYEKNLRKVMELIPGGENLRVSESGHVFKIDNSKGGRGQRLIAERKRKRIASGENTDNRGTLGTIPEGDDDDTDDNEEEDDKGDGDEENGMEHAPSAE